MILYIKLRNFNSHIKENVYDVYTAIEGQSRPIYPKSYRLGSFIKQGIMLTFINKQRICYSTDTFTY